MLDWEAEKRRIVARLEAETADAEDADGDRQRLQIREVVEKTDRIIADKQAEIEALQQVLQNQASNLGSLAVGAAAVGQLLDKDAVVREERENLRRLKQQWEEQMRQSEIETSIERAAIARQRAELEDRIKEFEARKSLASSSSHARRRPAGETGPRSLAGPAGAQKAVRAMEIDLAACQPERVRSCDRGCSVGACRRAGKRR